MGQIDVEPTETVGDVKAKIAKEHGHAVEQQKLIYSGILCRGWRSLDRVSHRFVGKILSDSNAIDSYKIKENDFIVLMVSKVSLL